MRTMNRLDWLGIAGIAAVAMAGAVACSSSSSSSPTPGDDASPGDATASSSGSGSGSSSSSGSSGSSGSSSGSSGSSSSGSSGGDSGPPTDAGPDGHVAESGAGDGGANVTLTVLNFDDWCSVKINGGAASTAGSIMASVPDGSTATIVATPASSTFVIGANPWFGVTQNDGGAAPGVDMGSGATETTTATVVVSANHHCVSVCCQFPNNTPTPCPTTNPCP